MWAVEERGSAEFVGVIGFWEPATWPGFELSYYPARRFWSQGYATEGARAALAHAFTAWQREHVISLINPKNMPSIRVAERIGERLQSRREHFGRIMLTYGLDRDTYLREVAPAGVTARRAG